MILLDLDGLGSNFHAGIERYLPWAEFKALTDLQQSAKLREIYLAEPNFFNNLPAIESYRALIEYLESTGERWMICTSAGQDHHDYLVARESKLEFLLREFGISANKVIVTQSSEEKLNYANQYSILVDDYPLNCEKFKEAGGFSVVVTANTYNPMAVCKEIGERIEEMHLLEVKNGGEFEHSLALDML